MGLCTRRHFLLSICFLQLVTVIERQVFDFLGYMWAPILANLFQMIFVLFGFFGAYQLRPKYILTYSIWNVLWIGWNVFLICFYLNVGILNRDGDILNLGTGSVSWFEVNGYGCKPYYNTNVTAEDPYRLVRPESVTDCLLDYHIIEVIHSGVQCLLAVLGLIGAICIGRIFIDDDDDDQFDFMGGDAKSPQHTSVHPMYVSYSSIPTTASATMSAIKNNLLNASKINNSSNTNTLTSQKYNNQSSSNRNSGASFGRISTATVPVVSPDNRFTILSTEKLVGGEDAFDPDHETYRLNCFNPNNNAHTNNGYIPYPRPDRSFVDLNDFDSRDDLPFITESPDPRATTTTAEVATPTLTAIRTNPHLQQHRMNHELAENYKMPLHYITRSPNLNRVSSRRRNERPTINFCDKIRDAPPGYNESNEMQRAKSQDRLTFRRQRQVGHNAMEAGSGGPATGSGRSHGVARPRSYCSNGYPEE